MLQDDTPYLLGDPDSILVDWHLDKNGFLVFLVNFSSHVVKYFISDSISSTSSFLSLRFYNFSF